MPKNMEIGSRVAAFVNQVAPAIKDSAASSMSQMKAAVRQASQPVANFFNQEGPINNFLDRTGLATGSLLAGSAPQKVHSVPQYRKYGGGYQQLKRSTSAAYSEITPPGGLLGAVGMNKTARQVQTMMLNPQTTQMVGAAALGAGSLGLAAAAGVGYMQNQRRKERIAGQKLGAQLGVIMPLQA